MTTIALPTTVTALPLRKPARGEGDTAPSARVACGLRRRLWRLAVAVTGGMTVTGRWRVSGGCVVVANHSSHADTAVLLAALPATARPVFAAAADYWFDVPVRRFVAGSLAGVLPVSRRGGGAYAGLLAAARPALRAGRCVVIYPEGTRSTDGEIGEFHSGAVRLARECGVPIVPIAVAGTADVLPKGGSYRRAPMAVHIGEPVDAGHVSPSQLREQVMALRDGRRPRNAPLRQAASGSDGSGPRGDHRGEPGGEQYRRNDQIQAVVAAQPRVQQLRQHPDHQPHHRDAQPPLQ